MRNLSVNALPVLAFIAMAATLQGCASMSKEECMTADWRTIGYEDGVAGYAGDRIATYRKACSEHGVTPDLDRYRAGRDEGLREYCKPANGYRAGARGNDYNEVCPAGLDSAYRSAYESGRQLYTLRSRVNSTANDISSLRSELERIEKDLVTTGARILDSATTQEQRAQYLVDSKQLAERKGEIKTLLPQLEVELSDRQRELDDFRRTVPYVE